MLWCVRACVCARARIYIYQSVHILWCINRKIQYVDDVYFIKTVWGLENF